MGAGVLTAESPAFPRRGGVLHCGAHSLENLAQQHQTPLYVYNGARILDRMRTLEEAFAGLALVAYSVKANPNLAVLELLARAGAGADIVSGGELYCALQRRLSRRDGIVFAGVGKTRDEMRYGLETGIRSFHVESAQELEALAEVAAELGAVPAPLADPRQSGRAQSHPRIHLARDTPPPSSGCRRTWRSRSTPA